MKESMQITELDEWEMVCVEPLLNAKLLEA